MPRTRRPALMTATLAVAALTGCAASDPTTLAGRADQQGSGGVPVVPAEAGHVHGMALNPSDGRLYLGTHAGTLVVEDDAISRVGESTVDLMGFAAAGPDHFYASGHPGPGDGLPNPVGLIETVDGGRTWSSLSLAGEVDFHTLGAAGDQVYGFGGQLVGSANGRDWTTGAADVAPASLAVDPDDPERLVATTEHGPALSEDAAATFDHLEGAPLLLFVAWPSPDALWGVAPDGTVYLSTDGGERWEPRGNAGAPSAFTAAAGGTLAVATESEIVVSEDDGRTFEPVAEVVGGGH